MNTHKTFLTVASIAILAQAPLAFALPHTIVLKNATDITQKVWLHSGYTVKQGALERSEQDLLIREILPRDSLVYGDRHHTFDYVEIKLNPTSGLKSPIGGTAMSGFDGFKSIITITDKDTYTIDNKVTMEQKQQNKEAIKQIKSATQEVALEARSKAQSAKQAVENKAEQAAATARQTARIVDDKAAHARDTVAQDARTARDTVREKTNDTAQKMREKALEAKEAMANGVARARDTVREKGHAAADTVREKTQDTKEAIANGVARVQNRTEEARIAASGRWAKMKAGMYNWWCSVKIKLSRLFRR